jgi:RAB protein geranylgeranyltransferase component A
MPTSTDLVTDLPADFNVFGQGVDTSLQYLLGGTTGQVLSKTSNTNMAFTWIEQDDTTLSFNAQTGTTYTLVASDSAKLVTASNASAITITIPPSVFTAGNQINVAQLGAGQVTFSQGAGVTIVSAGATASAPKIGKQYAAVTIICTSSNNFLIVGAVA